MDNLADLEKAYRVPCKHCAQQMQAWDLFCPSCGKDQTAAKAEPVASLAPLVPAVDEAPLAAAAPPQGGGSFTRARILIGIGAVLVVLLGAVLAHDHFVVDRQPPAEDTVLRDFRAKVQQLRAALDRNDLEAAAPVLDVLEARHLNDPAVQELRTAFDRRTQEQADARERLRRAAVPSIDVAPPKEKECNETLAALALCPSR